MIKLNQEYKYQDICKELGWKVSSGCSKQAQIKEIERCYEFYHPLNKQKTKEKKSYVFTKQISNPIMPSLKNNSGNCKMDDGCKIFTAYLSTLDLDNKHHTWTSWYYSVLGLLNPSVSSISFQKDTIDVFCKRCGINNHTLFKKYVTVVRYEIKFLLLRCLRFLQINYHLEYTEGYLFVYKLSDKSLGYIGTDILNDIVLSNETKICNDMNNHLGQPKNLSGRQNLLWINGDEQALNRFDERKIQMLMENEHVIRELNQIAAIQSDFIYELNSICKERPILHYYNSLAIHKPEVFKDVGKLFLNTDLSYGKQLTNLIRLRVRRKMRGVKYLQKDGFLNYPYQTNEAYNEMDRIERLLFYHYDAGFIDTDIHAVIDITDDEMKMMYMDD